MKRAPAVLLAVFVLLIAGGAILVSGGWAGSAPTDEQSPFDPQSREAGAGDQPSPTATFTPAPTATPTATPSPTPEPLSPNLQRCTEPRGPGSNANPAARDSVFRNCQVIAYYGNPDAPGLGVLGDPDRSGMVARLEEQAAAFDALGESRGVIKGFHLIVAVAQPTTQGTALSHMADDTIREWIALAEEHDALLILDTQLGHSTVEAEVERLLPYLENPRVHLALDPEWTMPEGVAPGAEIGTMHADDINLAQEMLQSLVNEHDLPNKMLMVHQFTPDMIGEKELLDFYTDVDLVIDMDGWGVPGLKIDHYNKFVRDDDARHAGIKLYFDQEPNLMQPEDLNALDPEPDIVIYQ